MNHKLKFSIYDMAIVGVMAAIVFVVTYFIKVPISTPIGDTMIKAGNVFCLLAGVLFGGVRGGLAAGIGSMMYDLFDPRFIAGAPFTLVFFFLMAFICGTICYSGGKKATSNVRNTIGITVGAFSYVVLHISKTIITLMINGSAFAPAVIASVPKLGISTVNAIIAIVFASIFAPLLKLALKNAGFYKRISQ